MINLARKRGFTYIGSREAARDKYEIKCREFFQETGMLAPHKDAYLSNKYPGYNDLLFELWMQFIQKQKMRIQLHPDPFLRDCYGVQTLGILHAYHMDAEAFVLGWSQCCYEHRHIRPWLRYARYSDIRGYILSLVDIEYVYACQIALFMTRNEGRVPPFDSILRFKAVL